MMQVPQMQHLARSTWDPRRAHTVPSPAPRPYSGSWAAHAKWIASIAVPVCCTIHVRPPPGYYRSASSARPVSRHTRGLTATGLCGLILTAMNATSEQGAVTRKVRGCVVLARPLALLLALATAFALPCPTSLRAVTIRDDVPDQSYLDLGGSSDYASVGTFSSGLTGCGTLIEPDWVLTAAHLFIASSGSFTLNGVTYTADTLIKYPGYQSGHELQGDDIGLAHLTTPVSGVTPATLYGGSLEPVSVMTFVGFGMTGTGLTGARRADFQKRAFQNMADGDFGNPAILLGSDFDNPNSAADNSFGDATPLPLEGCVANGDSGGGVFLTSGSQTYLAGVVSFVAATDGSANSDYGDVTGFGRVSAFASWINSETPEPSSAALLAWLGLGLLGWRRYRRRDPS